MIMLYLGMRASLLGGIIALTLVELPIMVRAMDEVVRMVPAELKEASYAMGATRWETMRCGRAAAGAAGPRHGGPAGLRPRHRRRRRRCCSPPATPTTSRTRSWTRWPRCRWRSSSSSARPFPEVQQRAYASALILLVIVLLVSVVSRLLSADRFSRSVPYGRGDVLTMPHISVRNLTRLPTASHRLLKDVTVDIPDAPDHRHHRALRLRQDHLPAVPATA